VIQSLTKLRSSSQLARPLAPLWSSCTARGRPLELRPMSLVIVDVAVGPI
jgi:hypothetical protein